MPRIYGYVRPYPGRLGRQVRDFVEDQGFVLGPGMVVAAGATDMYASRWIMRATMDLLVLPFHLHRGDGGRVLDAIGVLMSLPENVDLGGLTVLMPVRAFSWGSSFQRRMDLLKESRPHLAAQLIIAHQDEIGSPTLAARLRRAHARPPSTAPLVRSSSIAPPTVRELPPLEPHSPFQIQFQSELQPFVQGQLSAEVHPDLEREDPALSAGRFSEREALERQSLEPQSFEPRSAHFEITRDPTVSGMQLRRRAGDAHSLDDEVIRDGSQSSRPPGTAPSSGSDEQRTSLVLPRGDDTPESARESFRRAAEIGAKARQEGKSRKKGK